jgi:RNA polymerase sigma-70 factor (ECF subfamily)
MMNNDLQSCNRQALNALYEEFGGKIFKSAIFLTDSREEAEDIVQETFMRSYRSIHRFNGQSTLYTWLYRIFLNVTHDLRRKKYIHERFLSKYRIEQRTDPIEDPINDLDKDAFTQSLQDALKRQKLKHREIIVLRFFEDLKLQEIAERLNISIGTVKSRLHIALKKLKKSIGNIEQFANTND